MAVSSSSSLGRFSILKSSIQSSSSAASSSSCSSSYNGCFCYQNLRFNDQKQQKTKRMRMVAQGCDYRRSAVVSSNLSSATTTDSYLDTVFGTELKKKEEKKIQQQIQDDNIGLIREIKVGIKSIDEEQQQQQKQEVSSQISADKLDEWMTFSVPEIVKNIGEAPLLVHIYSSISKGVGGFSSIGSSSSSSSTSSSSATSSGAAAARLILEKEKAEAGSWNGVTKRWEEGSPVPDGIILVEQLKPEEMNGGGEDESEVVASDMSGSGTKTWGVVIQGRGVESASSCYILKTCRVGSSLGFCTHFCLARAKCFGESADIQLKNSWLLGH